MKKLGAAAHFWFWLPLCISIWSVTYPRPYALCIAAVFAIPVCALVYEALNRESIAILPAGEQDTTFFAFLFGMGALAYRGYHDVQIFSRTQAVEYAAIVAAFTIVALAMVEQKFRSWIAWIILLPVLTFTFGLGAVLEGDMLLDRSAPESFKTRVIDRHISWGRRYKTFSVHLARWGNNTTDTYNLIDGNTYYGLHAGGDACVDVGKGALRIEWYKIRPCK